MLTVDSVLWVGLISLWAVAAISTAQLSIVSLPYIVYISQIMAPLRGTLVKAPIGPGAWVLLAPVSTWSMTVLISLLLGTVLKSLRATAVHRPTSPVVWARLFWCPSRRRVSKISRVVTIKSTSLVGPPTLHTLPAPPS